MEVNTTARLAVEAAAAAGAAGRWALGKAHREVSLGGGIAVRGSPGTRRDSSRFVGSSRGLNLGPRYREPTEISGRIPGAYCEKSRARSGAFVSPVGQAWRGGDRGRHRPGRAFAAAGRDGH